MGKYGVLLVIKGADLSYSQGVNVRSSTTKPAPWLTRETTHTMQEAPGLHQLGKETRNGQWLSTIGVPKTKGQLAEISELTARYFQSYFCPVISV